MLNRRFRRVSFETQVKLFFEQCSYSCELLDIAMKGALLTAAIELPVELGNSCRINLSLPGSEISLDFQAELIHREEDRYGFKFISEDLETLTHLRKLIELNTGDVETTRSELDSWLSG